MKPVGGYFELGICDEDSENRVFPEAYPVNNGRAALELIIRSRKYKHLFVPDYICPVVLEKLKVLHVTWSVFYVNEKLEIDGALPKLQDGDGLLYINYFGVKDAYCRQLSARTRNLILDLTQAFFFTPPDGADAFNSARKFLGVPDGGYVFGDFVPDLDLPRTTSWQYCEHLLRRLDGDIGGGHAVFKKNEGAMDHWVPLRMSLLTERLINAYDLEAVKRKRAANFQFLQGALAATNRIRLEPDQILFPLCYPYLVKDGLILKTKLIENQIYCPTYWPGIERYFKPSRAASDLQENLVCLPIDQRYDAGDMACLVARCSQG